MKDFSNVTNPWKEWTIVKQIGRGSFGSVYEIERDAYGFKEKAALKVISVPNSESDLETMRNSNYDVSKWCRSIINDIFREYALMAQLKNCPNIVRCDDCKEIPHEEDEGSDVCIRMELLNPLSKMRREFSEEEVIRIGMDICSALIACGEASWITRQRHLSREHLHLWRLKWKPAKSTAEMQIFIRSDLSCTGCSTTGDVLSNR